MQSAPNEQPLPPESASRDEADEPRKVVLLVEDNEADRDMYGGLLWYNGYSVLYSEEGENALEVALATRPDLILLDINLPGELSGLDVAVRLRAEGVDVPIIALSAVPRAEIAEELEKAGIIGYLEKPITPFSVVKEVLRRLGNARRPSS